MIEHKGQNVATTPKPSRYLPMAAPVFAGNEKAYVNACLDSAWISSRGEFLDRFEREFAAFCGVQHALSCVNGTAALGKQGIETRPFFYPMHILPMYTALAAGQSFPVADSYAARGMNLPSGADLTCDEIAYVVQTLTKLAR